MMLAVRPQICYKTAHYLRNFRKYNTKLHFACGSSASMLQKCALFAELPQICRKIKQCLRSFRKQHTKMRIICGSSANDAQNEKMFVAISANTTRHRAPPSAQQLALTSRRHT